MKTLFLCYLLSLISACTTSVNNRLLQGRWKLEKVEVLYKGQLKKIIVDTSQYWQICKKNYIKIFNQRELQICLFIKQSKASFKSLDTITGNAVDEYRIDKLNQHELELSSQQKVADGEYTLVYFLEKQ